MFTGNDKHHQIFFNSSNFEKAIKLMIMIENDLNR